MTLVDWWLSVPERVEPKVPDLVKAILLPWFLLGIVIMLIPDLQDMPAGIRFVIGLPAAFGIVWMATGMVFMIADKLIALGSFIRRHLRKAQ